MLRIDTAFHPHSLPCGSFLLWITPVEKKNPRPRRLLSCLHTTRFVRNPQLVSDLASAICGRRYILLIPSDTFIRRCLFRTHQRPIILVSPPTPLPCCSHHTSCQAIYRPSCFPRSSNGPDHLSEVIASASKSHFFSHHRSLARPARVPSYL